MAIGVFDSGIGGLTVHRALTARFAAGDFIYLADQAHVPYGTRSGTEIVRLTRAGCERLFLEGCDLVLLACNTATAVALRHLQQSWLPSVRERRGRPTNILGIIVPTIEVATAEWDNRAARMLGIFATRATARTRVYEIEMAKRRPDIPVITEPCPELAGMIEQGAATGKLLRLIGAHAAALCERFGRPPDEVILGSTHYEVVADLFGQVLPPTTRIIQQPRAVAQALETYLERHREFQIGTQQQRRFLTTGASRAQPASIEAYWGGPLAFESA